MEKQVIDYYAHKNKMYVATDCIVFGFDSGELKLLIFRRKMDPHEGKWSLIGSIIDLDEDMDDAASRVIKDFTGLDNIFFEQTKAYGKADRDDGFRCVSVAQYALIRLDDYDKKFVEKHGAFWYRIKDLPDLVLDHNQMLEDALKVLRRKARYQPIGFELLPEKFTLSQLRRLYEAIYQRDIDSDDFRKKILSINGLLKLVDDKDKTSSKADALYKFDYDNYQKFLKSGFNFEI